MEQHAKPIAQGAVDSSAGGAIAELRPEPRPALRADLAPLPVEASRSTASAPAPAPPVGAAHVVATPSITVSDSRPRPAAAPRLRPSVAIEGSTIARFGDRAGEHLHMERGRFDAWIHVVIAYLFESVLLGALPAVGLYDALGLVTSDGTIAGGLGVALGGLIGAVIAWRVFRDRWRCIEAFASRFCSGLANLSIMYVPWVALIYANVRGFAKRRGE
jgi:hypothetical protein